jgi:hypothetical protein
LLTLCAKSGFMMHNGANRIQGPSVEEERCEIQ